jgi:thymidylate synthase
MYIPAGTLDDLLRNVYERLLRSRNRISPTKGALTELPGVLLKIGNPRTRLSRTEKRSTLFTCFGELLWYLAGSNDLSFISYYIPGYAKYSDDNKTIYGGYGPRMRGAGVNNQLATVINLLKRKNESRQAVVQLFDAADLLVDHKDIPCTCTLQFMIRRGRLHLFVNMRSNDAYMGLPHDVFAFTMLQEIMARALGVELGTYKHAVGSLHLYDVNREAAEQYIDEGWQSTVPMPPMPIGDPWPAIEELLKSEALIRNGGEIDFRALKIDPYWKDLIRILQIFQYTNDKSNLHKVASIRKNMSTDVYAQYITKRHAAKIAKTIGQQQFDIFPDSLAEEINAPNAKKPA